MPQVDVVAHIVEPGETLSGIARLYGADVKQVVQANAGYLADVNLIKVGWMLLIPIPRPDPEPGLERPRMLIGAATTPRDGETIPQAHTRFEQTVGPIDITRAYSTNWRLWGTHNARHHTGLRPVILSVKGDGDWDALIASIPDRAKHPHDTYVIATPHEVDRPDRQITGAQHQQTMHALKAAIDRSGRAGIHPAVCVTGYRELDPRPPAGYETSTPWFPQDPTGWLLLLDPYDTGNQTLQARCTPALNNWRQHGGTRWGIAETGTYRRGTDGAQWITAGYTWARAEGCEMIVWFDSLAGPIGNTTPPADVWQLNDPQMIHAYRQQHDTA